MKKSAVEKLRNIPETDLGDVYLRLIKYEDYDDFYECGSDDEVTKYLTWDSYKSVDDVKTNIQKIFLSRPEEGIPAAYAIVVKETDKMIGICDIFFLDWEREVGEIGYFLNRQYWNKGYLTKVCKAVMDFGFNYIRLDRIVIRHFKNNTPSKRVIEKYGFVYKQDVYWDKFDEYFPTYSLSKNEFTM